MAHNTRGHVNTAISDFIGPSKELPETDLPTCRDVLKQALHLRLLDGRDPRNYSNFDVAKDTAVLVLKSWQKANSVLADYPVIVSEQEISRRVKVLYDKVVYFTCGNKKSPGKKKREPRTKESRKK